MTGAKEHFFRPVPYSSFAALFAADMETYMARLFAIAFAAAALLVSAVFVAQAGERPLFFDQGETAVAQTV